ncbi:MAG TPA: Hpt domain-containing protein, partial [Ramlibacter sp.]|nr:Hpt domain-containing protein [Ramlibacter sp.]
PNDAQLPARAARLAQRLDTVRQGGQAQALEHWVEELYRRVSDRQTMGSVVGELRGTLSELEKLLDQFFRNPKDKGPLRDAPGYLSQMRGVLSVLGLDQAAQAVLHMRETVEEIIVTEIDEERVHSAGTFEKLGNNVGALGFLVDMLNYQPTLAKKLFVYDAHRGEFKPLMGRITPAAQEPIAAMADELALEAGAAGAAAESRDQLTAKLDQIATQAVLAEQPAVAQSARAAAAAVSGEDSGAAAAALSNLAAVMRPGPEATVAPAAEPAIEEDDLLDIFLEEAREVVQNGLAAIDALAVQPAEIAELTTLRRAFHTLKGSSRMVGLMEFGEAAWALEQVLNTWLADQKPASQPLLTLSGEAMQGFSHWVEDIAAHDDGVWKASLFRGPAEALRTEGRLVPINLPDKVAPAAAEPLAQPAQEESFPELPAAVEPEALPTLPVEPALVDLQVQLEEPAAAAIEFELPLEEVQPAAAPEPVALELPAGMEAAPDASMEVTELPPDFEFDLPPVPAADLPEPAKLEAQAGIEQLDFAPLSALATELPGEASADEPAAQAPSIADLEVTISDSVFDLAGFESPQPPAAAEAAKLAEPEPEPEPEAPGRVPHAEGTPPEEEVVTEGESEEPVKVIGTLRIGIPLYNVYLNEADEWSRRLANELAEWALELNQPMPDSTVGLAHALAGSSATVGFQTLSDIARALEHQLQKTQSLAYGTPQHGLAFTAAAEEIRRLLHQFAAGFLKEADARVAADLLALDQI